ncbi:hypothetical protein OEZ85_010264 [Tetradesmus obliquus]|uniref:Uncharacterized protein n=1 Tax=Tetradesmus obliquus TaxID=3088 RepID=A0ABY8TMD8_TETOB|nr:hypothetical protein OEZ85_010264 [Tetradesmus obliquus]
MAHCSAKLDEVSRNCILEEAIRREERTMRLNSEFTVSDPRKMPILPEKPNYTTPASQPTEQQLQAAHDKLVTLTNFKHTEHLPSQVYALPATGNMEYGFFSSKQLMERDNMFQHNKGHCDVTKYAASYTAMTGVTPFHNTHGAGGAAATKKK